MLLIADGGSTKVDWCLIDQGNIVKGFYFRAILFSQQGRYQSELADKLVPVLK